MRTAAPLLSSRDPTPPTRRSPNSGCGRRLHPPAYGFGAVDRMGGAGRLQLKPRIGAANDPLEREADRIADAMMAGGLAAPVSRAAPDAAQRVCAACEDETVRAAPGAAPRDGSAEGAARAVASGGNALPPESRDFFGARFGRDFSDVRIHVGTDAGNAALGIGARAYTLGRNIAFAPGEYAPDRPAGQRLLAHELAHVVQQGGHGGNVGESATIRRFTAFSGADQTAGKSLGWTHPASTDLRVSDDGEMVVEDKGWGANRGKRAWTTAAKMAESNAILAAQLSKVKFKAKAGTLSGMAPGSPKTAKSLVEIEPLNTSTGASINLASDCGDACKEVTGSGSSGKDVAVMNDGKAATYTKPRSYHGGDPTTPELWSEEIYKTEFGSGLTRAQAYAKYDALSAADKKKFAAKYGINKFAVPKVGQGITVSTEKDMPGYSNVPGASMTWNFHFAATVLASGVDYVTLENAAGWLPSDWIFFMYGPAKKSQSFHEFHGATDTHGTDWTTMVVQPEKTLHVVTNAKDAPLLVGASIVKLDNATPLEITRRAAPDSAKTVWLDVTVESGPNNGKKGKIRSTFVK